MDSQTKIAQLENKISQLEQDLSSLSSEYYKNNFTGSQDFQKYCRFNTRLKVPHYASTPSTGEQGEIIEVGGILYVCSAANTWTKVGLQS